MDRLERSQKLKEIKEAISEIDISYGRLTKVQEILEKILEVLEEDEYFFENVGRD